MDTLERSLFTLSMRASCEVQPDQEACNLLTSEIEEWLTESLSEKNHDVLRKTLAQLQENAINHDNSPVSRPRLSVFFMWEIFGKSIFDEAIKRFAGNDPLSFAFLYDLATVFNITSTAILDAEEQISKGDLGRHVQVMSDVMEKIDSTSTIPNSASISAEIYLHLTRKSQQFAELLKKDPTGFLLFDYIAENPYRFFSGDNLISDAIPAGTRLAQQAYKVIYPITTIL